MSLLHMYTAQSTVSTVHTSVMSQLIPERDQSSGSCGKVEVLENIADYVPALDTYIAT